MHISHVIDAPINTPMNITSEPGTDILYTNIEFCLTCMYICFCASTIISFYLLLASAPNDDRSNSSVLLILYCAGPWIYQKQVEYRHPME